MILYDHGPALESEAILSFAILHTDDVNMRKNTFISGLDWSGTAKIAHTN